VATGVAVVKKKSTQRRGAGTLERIRARANKPGTAAEFLRAVTPPGTHGAVLAFDPLRGPVDGLPYTSESLDNVEGFLQRNEGSNFYWTPNPLKRPMRAKATKADIAAMAWVHADIDALGDDVLQRIREYRVSPTMIVCSGGGYNAYWRLETPIHANGNLSELEQANLTVVRELGGDIGTQNLDRILRLPGTMNWPTKTKLKRGRVPVEATLVDFFPERRYSLDDFRPVNGWADAGKAPTSNADEPGTDDEPRDGAGSEPETGDASRSGDLLRKVADDIRAHLADEAIHAKHDTHPHAADQSDPARAVQRCIDKVRREASDVVAQVNAKHALIFVGPKLLAVWTAEFDDGLPRLSTIADLRTYWKKHQRGKTSPIDLWLGSSRRREYSGFTFRPGGGDTGDKLNLFRGWGVQPDPRASCALFLAHLHEVVCGRDDDAYDYLLQWLADTVQRPEDKPGTAIALGSGQGAGKGTIGEYIGPIFGHHLARLNGSDQLLGRFNDLIAGKLLVFGDEAAWPGDRRGIEKLKSYITEARVTVERKHIPAYEIHNHCRYIFATNSSHFAPAEIDDRRFVVLKVGDHRIGDFKYWSALAAERVNGGPAALLHHLLNVKLTRNLRITPKTSALTANKLAGLDDVGNFVRHLLLRGKHRLSLEFDAEVGGTRFIELEFGECTTTDALHRFYLAHARRTNVRYVRSLDALGMALRRYLTLSRREARTDERERLGLTGRRERVYALPTLAEAREQFEAALGGQPIGWELATEGQS